MKNIDNAINQKIISSSEELDIRFIVNFFVRNKLLVGSFSILFMVLFSLYSLTLKRIWEGQFQIVLSPDKNTQRAPFSSGLPISLSSLGGGPDNLKTEVGILKSPSVLKPIYKIAKIKM